MGQTLSEPITTKDTSAQKNEKFMVGSSAMQGWRISMEDAHSVFLSLPGDPDAALFAVFDGHGNANIAKYADASLYEKILSQPAYKNGDFETAIKEGFLKFDSDIQADSGRKEDMAGTTALVVLSKNNKIYCGNVGDSRAIASVNGHLLRLSKDHKPNDSDETARIWAAGGWVENNRVNGNLAMSRALGDFIFKRNLDKPASEQIVSALPDVVAVEITEDFEFLVLACDGIWDVLSNREVLEYVRARIASQIPPETICEELMDSCLATECKIGGLGCDNMTVVIVAFLHGKKYEDLAEKCKVKGSLVDGIPLSPSTDNEEVEEEEEEENNNDVDDNEETDDNDSHI